MIEDSVQKIFTEMRTEAMELNMAWGWRSFSHAPTKEKAIVIYLHPDVDVDEFASGMRFCVNKMRGDKESVN